MSILQWNVRGLIGKWAECKYFLSSKSPLGICLQETRFRDNDTYDFSIRGYSLYTRNSNAETRQRGVALYGLNTIPHCEIPLQTTLQAVACHVNINNHRFVVCSLYLPPNVPVATQELDQLFGHFDNDFVICTDANAKHALWGSPSADRRGRMLAETIFQHDLHVLNDGSGTRLDVHTGAMSHIDLTLCTTNLAHQLAWRVQGDNRCSDHFPIDILPSFCTVHVDSSPYYRHRWSVKRADWAAFSNDCHLQVSPEDPHNVSTLVTQTILDAARKHVPQVTRERSKHYNLWWNDACKRAIAKRKRALIRYKRCVCPDHLIDLQRERAVTQRTIRNAKKESWIQHINTFTSSTPISKIWTMVRAFGGRQRLSQPLPVLVQDGRRYDSPEEVTAVFGNYFSSLSDSINHRPAFQARAQELQRLVYDFPSNNDETYNMEFTMDELDTALRRCGATSVGPDGIHYFFLKHLNLSSKRELLTMFNILWVNDIFPQDWKKSYIIPIHKSGKPREMASSYRPIQLTSNLCKTMERMINDRLMWYLESQSVLSPFQSGFRKGRQCLDNTVRLETDIRCGFYLRYYTVAVFLDMHSAYNMVSVPALLQKLEGIGLRGHLPIFVKNFLSGRTFRVDCKGLSDEFNQKNGVVQGGVLSPTLFLIMINDICNQLPHGVSYSLFADDCAIWAQGTDLHTVLVKMQRALDCLETWTTRWGMLFSGQKSSAVIFSRYRTRPPPDRTLNIQGTDIPYVDHARFLGIVFDSRLNMRQHIDHVKTKVLKRHSLLQCISRISHGADRKTMLRLYKALVRPVIDYGSQVYDGGAAGVLKELEPLQNRFIRLATGAFRTTPVPALLTEADIQPLWLRRVELTLRFALRVRADLNHPAYLALQKMSYLYDRTRDVAPKRSGFPIGARVQRYLTRLHVALPTPGVCSLLPVPPWTMRGPRYLYLPVSSKSACTPAEFRASFLQCIALHPEFTVFFTDGSKHRSSTACAFVFDHVYFDDRLPDDTSVFCAELFALLRALQYILSRRVPRAIVCSDSKSALQCLTNTDNTRSLVRDIQMTLHEIERNRLDVLLMWIPGHVGILGNERADYRAKQALTKEDITPIPPDYRDILSVLRGSVAQWFSRWWRESRPTFLKTVKPTTGEWVSSYRRSRREEVALARLRLGHTRLTHSGLFNNGGYGNCSTCHSPLSVVHILLQCRKYDDDRRFLRRLCATMNVPLNLAHILSDEHPALIDAVCIYLGRTQLLGEL